MPETPTAEKDAGCGSCGHPLDGDYGYTGATAYHRYCARKVYGAQFVEMFRDFDEHEPPSVIPPGVGA